MANGGQEYSLNLGLDVLPISTDKDNLPDLNRLYNAVKGVARGLDDYTGAISVPKDEWSERSIGSLRLQNMCRVYAKTGEELVAGQFVSLTASGSELYVLAANATNPSRFPRGFVLESFSVGDYVEVYLSGLNYKLAGLTPGGIYKLDNTGAVIPEGVAGTYHVYLGIALATNAIWFTPNMLVV